MDCPVFTDNVVIELTVVSGLSAIYASTEIVNPSPVNYAGVTYRDETEVPVGSVKTLVVPVNGKEVSDNKYTECNHACISFSTINGNDWNSQQCYVSGK